MLLVFCYVTLYFLLITQVKPWDPVQSHAICCTFLVLYSDAEEGFDLD